MMDNISSMKTFKRIETKLIHAGEPEPRVMGAVSLPIFQTAMFEYAGEESYHDIRYIRLNNSPNHLALHRKLAALENAEAGLVAASGMAAITTTLLTVLSAGDHLLTQDCLYGGTHDFLTQDFAGFGLEFDFIDGDDPDSWKSKLRPNTKAIYVEAMSNPTLQVSDLNAAAAFAKEHGLVSIIDNTFPSPINFRPAEWGFDVSLHSCTKYLNGHSDIVGGACIGRADLIEKITHKLNHLGGSMDPHAAFLLHRGMKTLALRVRCQNESAEVTVVSLAPPINPPTVDPGGDSNKRVRLRAGARSSQSLVERLLRVVIVSISPFIYNHTPFRSVSRAERIAAPARQRHYTDASRPRHL
jgi:cystathionine beta-lyase/cystathionine gamma-synthase